MGTDKPNRENHSRTRRAALLPALLAAAILAAGCEDFDYYPSSYAPASYGPPPPPPVWFDVPVSSSTAMPIFGVQDFSVIGVLGVSGGNAASFERAMASGLKSLQGKQVYEFTPDEQERFRNSSVEEVLSYARARRIDLVVSANLSGLSSKSSACDALGILESPHTSVSGNIIVRLLDSRQGAVVNSQTRPFSDFYESCRAMTSYNFDSFASSYVSEIAPRTSTVNLKFRNALSGEATPEQTQSFSNAMEFARSKRMDRACGIWSQLLTGRPEDFSLLYNLGACAELDGDINTAAQFYVRADQRLDKPDPEVNAALLRVRKIN